MIIEKKCKNCGAELYEDSLKKELYCGYCGSTFKMTDDVQRIKYEDMEQAGYDYEKGRMRARQEYVSSKFNVGENGQILLDPVIEFIIVFFFGALGVHKFMKKEIGMGILYLFTGGIFGIGWIIDVIRALTNLINSRK